ncbi:hypothetical protein [Pseudonocardia sp. H11422]|uniref:hypothetical protein n=1 Tax=Pseudonocardia sp. H11422 TaxID=2835866 RepID=UPI001BDC6EA9|nr:hypothetical protein [Pseudonocardia sp. H11422]
MSDQARGVSDAVARRRAAARFPAAVTDTGPFPGRHASRSEIAAETPIFHSLTVGGWRSRQHEPAAPPAPPTRPAAPDRPAAPVRPVAPADPLTAFRRDPLTAPIPIQALAPPPREPAYQPRRAAPSEGAHAMPERAGRHRQLAPARAGAGRKW